MGRGPRQTKAMLRRRLLAVLLCLWVAGLSETDEAIEAVMHGDHACMQHAAASAADCSSTGMMANGCALHCAAAACVVSNAFRPHFAIASIRPLTRDSVLDSGLRRAPETAPPKVSLADPAA